MEAVDALTRAGLPEPQAGVIAATMRKAVSDGVATKGDVAELRAELKGDIGAVKAELWAVKWALGFMLAIVPAMAARLFGIVQESRPPLGRPRREVRLRGGSHHDGLCGERSAL